MIKYFNFLDIDDCDPSIVGNVIEGGTAITEFGLCGKHGKCIDGIASYNCSCYKGWTGEKCDQGIFC